MGLTATGLGLVDQTAVRLMGVEIISVLRNTATKLREGDSYSQVWFGDSSQVWISQLRTKLNRMASVINLQSINIRGTALSERGSSFAAALRPAAGWRNNTANVGALGFVSRSQNQNFQIELDSKWNTAPQYRSTTSRDSKFQTLVHELTHLIIDTEDEVYGAIKARALAITDSARAKINADSWGYFVEEFR